LASILIIDDDAALLASLGTAIEEEGYTALTISDVDHARQLFADKQPDLVILEVRTGYEQGWALIGEFADTPVIVVSAAALEEDVVRGLDAGACDYIAKPYRTRELLARVRSRLSPQPIAQPAPASPAPALAAQPEADVTPPAPPVALDDEPPVEPELPAAELPLTPPPAAPRPAWVTTTKPLMGQEPRRKRPKPEEESVFISEAEELALMRAPLASMEPLAAPRAAIDEPPRTIGQRLRNERLRRQLTLVQIENEIRVRISYLQAMEDDKFTLIPRGPSSQQMLKAYAEYLGVDSAAVLDEFRKTHYVDLIDPLPALGGTPLQRNLPRWLLGLIAVLLALAIAAGVIAYLDPQFFFTLGERVAALWAWLAQYLPG
jgi:CheY-like chemotaxis protein